MTVVNAVALSKAGRKDVPLRKALEKWLQSVEMADWRSLKDVRRTFPAADGVVVRRGALEVVATVFNIKGNEYRLIAVVNYSVGTVLICEVLNHAEYTRDRWKDRL